MPREKNDCEEKTGKRHSNPGGSRVGGRGKNDGSRPKKQEHTKEAKRKAMVERVATWEEGIQGDRNDDFVIK